MFTGAQANKHVFQAPIGYLAISGGGKGLGVFASRAVVAGETVELSPVLVLTTGFMALETGLQRRVYDWERLAGANGSSALALGYGSMYNHANPANMRYESAFDGAAIRFVSVRDIAIGEELTINYNSAGSCSDDDIWFKMCDIVMIEHRDRSQNE